MKAKQVLLNTMFAGIGLVGGIVLTYLGVEKRIEAEVNRRLVFSPSEFEKLRKENNPILYDTVKKYADRYDQDSKRLKFPTGDSAYKGFVIDKKGMDLICGLQHNYEKVYIRLGKKADGRYTLMLLPMKDTNLVQGDSPLPQTPLQNYDNLEPCPDDCPRNFRREHIPYGQTQPSK